MSSPRHETPHDLFEAARQCAACGHVYDSRQAHVCPAPRLEVDVELASLRARLLGAEQQRDKAEAQFKGAVDYLEATIRPLSVVAAIDETSWDRCRRQAIQECLNTFNSEREGRRYVTLDEQIRESNRRAYEAEQARETLRRERDELKASLRDIADIRGGPAAGDEAVELATRALKESA